MADKRPHAILVAHGIGQQRPYQVLDSFSQGLWKALPESELTHCKDGGGVFDHFVRIQDPEFEADVYEFYWAPMAVGQATFGGIVRWILQTAFTPLRRLSYNVPLILARAQHEARFAPPPPPAAPQNPLQRAASGLVAPLALSAAAFSSVWAALYYLGVTLRHQIGIENWLSLLIAITFAAALIVLRRLYPAVPWAKVTFQLIRELWRIVWVPVVGVTAAIDAAYVVSNIERFGKSLWQDSSLLAPASWGPADRITAGAFFCAGLAFLALLISWRDQLKDLSRVRERAAYERARRGRSRSSGPGAELAMELRGRQWLLVLTPIALALLALFLWNVGTTGAGKTCSDNWFCVSPVVADVLRKSLANRGAVYAALRTAALLLLAAFIKRVYIDYVGDVALYTTADENSEYFKTRQAILQESTRKVRWLLRRYERVSVVGHSLGSVIMYDTLGRLRLEHQVPHPVPLQPKPDEDREINTSEFLAIRHLVTFGSPLNKVLYLFRTTVAGDEIVRSHILQEIHGLRRPPEFNTDDVDVQDHPSFSRGDNFNWLNVYAWFDPVSARLDFYDRVDNQRLPYWKWGICHMQYWHDARFYDLVLRLMRPAPSPPSASAKAAGQ